MSDLNGTGARARKSIQLNQPAAQCYFVDVVVVVVMVFGVVVMVVWLAVAA